MWRRLVSSRVAPCKFRSFSSRQRGVVVYWDDHRAFGKVRSNDGKELFLHKSSLREEVTPGSAVDFEVQWVEEKKQDHAKDVRLVKPEVTLDAASRIQAVRAEDLMKVEPLDLTPDATEGQHLEMMAKQMDQLRQQGLQSQQLLAQNQQLLVQSQQLLVQGLFALIQQQNVQNANLERALLALTNKMGMELPESRLQADLPLKFPSTGSMPGAADMSTASAPQAEVQPAAEPLPNPSPEQEVVTPVREEGVKPFVEREGGAQGSDLETSAKSKALEEEAETSEEEPLESEPTTTSQPAERDLHAKETQAEPRQAEVAETSAAAEEEETSAVEAEPEKAGSFNLVGSFNDWDAENYPLQGDSWRVSIRNNAPMGSRKGFQREEFQILQDGSWETRLFPAGGTEETVVLLRPGRWNRAAMSSEEHPGHGRNWAVEGKPGAAFKVSLKDRTVSCEHA